MEENEGDNKAGKPDKKKPEPRGLAAKQSAPRTDPRQRRR
jgi:hypothetical protein